MDTKLAINLREGTITAEGSEEFVRFIYADFADAYHKAKAEGSLEPLPDELALYLPNKSLSSSTVYSVRLSCPSQVMTANQSQIRSIDNFDKKEFQELWKRINRRAVYRVEFDSASWWANALRP